VRDELAFGNLSEPFIQAGQKLGLLRDLLKFRTRKFWQLGNDFIVSGDGGDEAESLRWRERFKS
jgi:hypothetical protein